MADAKKTKSSASGLGKRKAQDDPLEGSSGTTSGHKKSKPSRATTNSAPTAPSKLEQRRHKAIEKAFLKAQSQAEPAPPASTRDPPSRARSPAPSRGSSIKELSPDVPVSEGPAPLPGNEPLFQTLPAADQDHEDQAETQPSAPQVLDPPSAVPKAFELIIARAIRQGLAQCFQQGSFNAGTSTAAPIHQPPMVDDSMSEQDLEVSPTSADLASVSEPEELLDSALSDDEGLVPDQPPFIGLFRPQIFQSLLHKAIATTCLGSVSSAPSSSTVANPASAMFAEPSVEPETIPAPKLFLDVLHRQWSLPGSGPSPNGLDKRLYNSASALSDLLLPPSVDPPIVALCNAPHPMGPTEDALRPEDRRAKKTLLKGHQAVA